VQILASKGFMRKVFKGPGLEASPEDPQQRVFAQVFERAEYRLSLF
jgi:hypothetical protein